MAYEDDEDNPLVSEMTEQQRAACVRSMAFELFQCSVPRDEVEPEMAPERAFTLAEEFLAEAKRRGY